MHRTRIGFTLVELVIVITIISLLTLVGVPLYQNYLMESRRSDAINSMRENQLIVEQYIQSNGIAPTSGQVTLKSSSEAGYYDLTYTRVSDSRYKIVATAVSGKAQAKDTACTVLTLISEMDSVYPAACS